MKERRISAIIEAIFFRTPCNPVLGEDFPGDISWENAYMIQGSDGSAWQRAIISNKEQKVILKEGEEVEIFGTGQPNAPVQVFVFHPTYDDSDNLTNRPGSGSNCWNIGTADNKGFFSFAINAQHLWGNIGEEMIFDVYTQLEDSWDQYVDEETNQNFFIGTNLPMGKLSVEVEQTLNDDSNDDSNYDSNYDSNDDGCSLLCKDTYTVLAHKLVPTTG